MALPPRSFYPSRSRAGWALAHAGSALTRQTIGLGYGSFYVCGYRSVRTDHGKEPFASPSSEPRTPIPVLHFLGVPVGIPNGADHLWGALARPRCPASLRPTTLEPTVPAAAASDRQGPSDRQGIALGDVTTGSKTAGGDGPVRQAGAFVSPEYRAPCKSPGPTAASTHARTAACYDASQTAKKNVGGVAV
jgi:hypothetical protein